MSLSGILNAEHLEGLGRKLRGKMITYCMKCRTKRSVKNGHLTETKFLIK